MTGIPKFVESNADSKPYWEAAQQGRLVFKKCLSCGYVQFPPRHLCPKCWSEKSEWITSSGEGEVYSFSIVRRAPTPAHAAKVPYVIAMIKLMDAPRMIANIVGDDALEVNIGDPVQVTFEPWEGGMLPQFRRVGK
jgi:uncharacterized protein